MFSRSLSVCHKFNVTTLWSYQNNCHLKNFTFFQLLLLWLTNQPTMIVLKLLCLLSRLHRRLCWWSAAQSGHNARVQCPSWWNSHLTFHCRYLSSWETQPYAEGGSVGYQWPWHRYETVVLSKWYAGWRVKAVYDAEFESSTKHCWYFFRQCFHCHQNICFFFVTCFTVQHAVGGYSFHSCQTF